MDLHGRDRIAKASLPQSRHIEQTFHQQDTRRARCLRPTKKSPFGPWQETIPADVISQRLARIREIEALDTAPTAANNLSFSDNRIS